MHRLFLSVQSSASLEAIGVSRPNPDGSVSVGVESRPRVATLRVTRTFRGGQAREEAIVGGGECDLNFTVGEEWLVYGETTPAGTRASKCDRTRLLVDAQADVRYLESREQGVKVGGYLRQCLSALCGPRQKTAVVRT